jgi:hypothetical protein
MEQTGHASHGKNAKRVKQLVGNREEKKLFGIKP